MSKEPSDAIEDAFTGAGLEIAVDDAGIKINTNYIKLKRIEWLSPTKCYAILPDGSEIPIYFTDMENQIVIR